MLTLTPMTDGLHTAGPARGRRVVDQPEPAVAESLLHRVANGDMAAMQECIDTYSGLIWSLAHRVLPSASEAEDAVQETFISLWENAERYDPEKGAEVTFVATIARRRLIDRGRKRQRRQRLVEQVAEEKRPPDSTVDPDAASTLDEAGRAMQAMESLRPEQQRVLRLAIHQGYTHEQIAEITEMPLGTVKTHARRGLIRIREMLAESEVDEPVKSKP